MSPPAPKTPAKRADAERNREKILEAARIAFCDADAEVSMAEISRRAEVGMATLYRNFANRRALLEALYVDEVDAVCRAATARSEGDSPGDALVAWLRRFFVYFTGKRQVAFELLVYATEDEPVFDDSRTRVLAAGRPLLAAAQAAGEVRDDLSLEQVLQMVASVARIEGDSAYVEPILQTVLAGLRTPGGG